MTTVEENDRLTKVGPATPMGTLMRRYWQVIAPVAKLDEDPVQKVRMLGEDLVLYRDRSGELGLIGSVCAHRSVDLKYGIPEEHGLRCPYHGWCYDGTGQCIESPLEAENSRLKDHIKIPGYPVQELGGIVWGYMGPLPAPVLPRYDFLVWPNSIRQIGVVELNCNWLQCQENAFDPHHGKYLHGHFFEYQLEKLGLLDERAGDQGKSRISAFMRQLKGAERVVVEKDRFGLRKGMKYLTALGADRDFVSWFPSIIFPNMLAGRGTGGKAVSLGTRTPIDDTHTLLLMYHLYFAPGITAPVQDRIPYFEIPMVDDTGELILDHVSAQDWAAWASQGEVTDRTHEHLGATDLGIIAYREALNEQLDLVEQGKEPTLNFFRESDDLGDCVELFPPLGSGYRVEGIKENALDYYHEGYWRDEIDRYGLDAATPMVIEMSRQAAELRKSN